MLKSINNSLNMYKYQMKIRHFNLKYGKLYYYKGNYWLQKFILICLSKNIISIYSDAIYIK